MSTHRTLAARLRGRSADTRTPTARLRGRSADTRTPAVRLFACGSVRVRTAPLSGQVLILFMMFLSFVLLLFVGVGVDVSGAYRVKGEQTQIVKLTQDSLAAYGNALKFSDDARDEAKKAVVQTLADNRYTGTAELWLYEVGSGYTSATGTDLPTNHRVMGATLILSGEYKTVFMQLAGSGMSTIPVTQTSTFTIDLYSKSAHVWRPSMGGSSTGYGTHVTWKVVDGAASVTSSVDLHDISGVPSGLSAALSSRVDSLADGSTP